MLWHLNWSSLCVIIVIFQFQLITFIVDDTTNTERYKLFYWLIIAICYTFHLLLPFTYGITMFYTFIQFYVWVAPNEKLYNVMCSHLHKNEYSQTNYTMSIKYICVWYFKSKNETDKLECYSSLYLYMHIHYSSDSQPSLPR